MRQPPKTAAALPGILLCAEPNRTFIREWRKHRGLSLEELGARIGKTHGQVSKIERGLENYKQPVLEAIARELGTTPAALLSRAPTDADGVLDIWDRIPADRRPLALDVLRPFAAPIPPAAAPAPKRGQR